MKCRHCGAALIHNLIDLGFAPPSNAYRSISNQDKPEKNYPLRVKVCEQCWLVQTEDYTDAEELFSPDYAYFSSTSKSWLEHAKIYATNIVDQLNLSKDNFVIEIAANDGYLLKNFVEKGIPCLGIEPTASTAQAGENLGIPMLRAFFGEILAKKLAEENKQADLIIGNNVYAHVPDINDFTRGLKAALKDGGIITLEFPHLMQLIEKTQFDTIYHEHFSYLSLHTVEKIFKSVGLRVWHVECLPTHGGSLRVYGCHEQDSRTNSTSVEIIKHKESDFGLQKIDTYLKFQQRAEHIKDDLLLFLIECKRQGRKVAAYGAAAKGNTLLNFAGIKPDLLPYVCDAALSKQGKLMPGSHIPIHSPGFMLQSLPDDLLVLPWNLIDEIKSELSDIASQGVCFWTVVPRLEQK